METNETIKGKKSFKDFITIVHCFIKKYKKLSICVAGVLLLCLLTVVVISIIHAGQAQKMKEAQIGKCYIEKYSYEGTSGSTTEIHYFTEDGVSSLYVSYNDEDMVDFVTGSLNEFDRNFSFRISLTGTPYLKYTSSATPVVLDENNKIIHYCHDWELISIEDAMKIEEEAYKGYTMSECEHVFKTDAVLKEANCASVGEERLICTLCDYENINEIEALPHTFGESQVIKEATCSTAGEEKQICQICGYEQINEIETLAHQYKNKICSVCGQKKPVEKADIEANTWYTYQDSVLEIQNCLVKYATSVGQGRGMMVNYYAVCQYCHVIDDESKFAGPEVNYDVSKIHYCDECDGQTMVKFRLR